MTKSEQDGSSIYTDTDQQQPITEGMQGADGPANANGLDPERDPQEQLQELEKNMTEIQEGLDK